MSLITVIVPVYHNATSLPDLLSELQNLASRNAYDTFEFIFVDDGSQDQSLAVLQKLVQQEPPIQIIKIPGFRPYSPDRVSAAG